MRSSMRLLGQRSRTESNVLLLPDFGGAATSRPGFRMTDERIDFDRLYRYVGEQCPLHGGSAHGPSHWRRVEQFGVDLAREAGADLTVVRLFAVFHDSRRQNEFTDHEHGLRGAELAQLLRGQLY